MDYIDGLEQERRNSSALAMELRRSCTNPSTWTSLSPIRDRFLLTHSQGTMS